MTQTAKMVVDQKADIRLAKATETTLLSESRLASDWVRSEEDEAWSHLHDLADLAVIAERKDEPTTHHARANAPNSIIYQ